jgi:hypothetical protein
MEKELKQFIKEKAIPDLKNQIIAMQYNLLAYEFKILKINEKIRELEKTPILQGDKWKRQLEEQAIKREEKKRELENFEKLKEKTIEEINELSEYIQYLEKIIS